MLFAGLAFRPCWSAGFVHASVVVHLDVITRTRPDPQVKNARPDSQTPMTLTLADRQIVVTSGHETTVYDFELRKRTVIDDDAKTRVDYSLYDQVGFAAMQLYRRAFPPGSR